MASEDYKRLQANRRTAAKVYQRMSELERGAPLNNGGVGEGGITVWGGSIRILEGGNLEVDGDASFEGDTNVGGALDVTGKTTLGGATGITGDLTVTGKTTLGGATGVTGDLTVSGAATFGGTTKIGGNAEITGTLKLPAGIIGNDALAAPATFDSRGGAQTDFTVGTTAGTFAKLQIPVPAGYTRAVVMVLASAYGRNPGPGMSYLYVGAQIGTVGPNRTTAQAEEGKYANGTGSATRIVTGLNGGTIDCYASLRAHSGTWTDVGANVDAIAIFLR